MANLELEGAVAEGAASLDAFSAAYAELLFDLVFEEGVFDEFPFDGVGGAELVFGPCVECFSAGFEISPAEVAVAAHCVCVGAFDRRRTHHTAGCAAPALYAFGGIELPYHLPGREILGQTAAPSFAAAAAGKSGSAFFTVAGTQQQASAEKAQGGKDPAPYESVYELTTAWHPVVFSQRSLLVFSRDQEQ